MLVTGPHGLRFEIPEPWMHEAGADVLPPDWHRTAWRGDVTAYAVDFEVGARLAAFPAPLGEIEPPRRAPGIVGLHRGQFVSVARAMIAGEPLPPVPVEVWPHGRFRYMPRDGFHRYHASIALGFSHLPVTAVPSL